MTEAEILELAGLYAEETQLSTAVCAAFVRAETEPPHRSIVDERGWSMAQRKVIDDHYEFAELPKVEVEDE